MKQVIRYSLAFIGVLVIFFVINFILSLYYYHKYQSSVKSAVSSFLDKEIAGDLKGTYDFLSDKRKALNPYDIYIQRIKNSTEPKAKSCEIIYLGINSVVGTGYIGPQATVKALCQMSDSQTLTSQYSFIKQGDDWKIE